MTQSNITIYPASTSYGAFLEIKFATPSPAALVTTYRRVLVLLLDGFSESNIHDGATLRAYGVRLLSWLYPLPAQMMAGCTPVSAPPPPDENGGFYFTGDGFALRFGGFATFEELETISRAVMALACFNAYELNDITRAALFGLIENLRPNRAALAALIFPKGLPDGYRFDIGEKESIEAVTVSHGPRADLLRAAMATPAERLNARWFKALAMLNASPFTDTLVNKMLEIVATGEELTEQE